MTDLGGKREYPTPHDLIQYLSPQSYMAKYLVVAVEKGITSEVMHFILFDDAKTAFEDFSTSLEKQEKRCKPT